MNAINFVSACCHREIIIQTRIDSQPLGRNEYNGGGISYSVDACSSCGLEADAVAVTECCGMEVCECELEDARMDMEKKAAKFGTTHEDTIVASQLVDALLNELNRKKVG